MPWGAMPEGGAATTRTRSRVPLRAGQAVGTEGPHGRDYFGGDLAGITQKMAYLKSLGVTVVYPNPIFWAGSNRYDTRDYTKIDPYLGKQADFVKMVKAAHKNRIKVLLDGVFNHVVRRPDVRPLPQLAGDGRLRADLLQVPRLLPSGRRPASPRRARAQAARLLRVLVRLRLLPKLTEFGSSRRSTTRSAAQKWLKLGADGWRLDVM